MTYVEDLRLERGIDDTCDEVSDISSILPSSVDSLLDVIAACFRKPMILNS